MARPLRLHVPGVASHVVGRGNAKQCIFEDDRDYLRFLELLERYLGRFGVDCLSYCLMWNHLHLLLVPHRHSLSRLMQQLNSRYCQWFNRRHGRVGHVLQGRFASTFVDDDAYMLRVLRYIARNPVEAALVARAEDWPWSSYRFLMGLAPAPGFLAVDRVWRALNAAGATDGRKRLAQFVNSADEGAESIGALLYGGENLIETIDPMLDPHRSIADYRYVERFATRPAIQQLLESAVTRHDREDAARTAFMVHAYSLSEIGAAAGRQTGTVWAWIKRSEARQRRTCEAGTSSGGVLPLE
jgi:REP element-mobilizing transposase RayT